MSKALPVPAHTPMVDLDILKDTIAYMHDDVRRVSGMEDLARALDTVLVEIENAQAVGARKAPPRIAAARFLPVWR